MRVCICVQIFFPAKSWSIFSDCKVVFGSACHASFLGSWLYNELNPKAASIDAAFGYLKEECLEIDGQPEHVGPSGGTVVVATRLIQKIEDIVHSQFEMVAGVKCVGGV